MLKSLASLRAVADVLETTVSSDAPIAGYSIDSRTLRPGELFFAVKGERTDGHKYVDVALKAGAAGAVVESPGTAGVSPACFLVVPDTLAALQRLGAEARRRWGGRVVAVTGSAGKTTTKEMIAAILMHDQSRSVCRSEGNLNNHFGLPLSLLHLEEGHDAGVFELAMSHPGEIAALARLAQPDTGVVTCIAPVHLEFFDSVEGIAKAKYELIESLPPTGTAVLNADDPYISRFEFAGRKLTFGIDCPADFRAEHLQEGEVTSFDLGGVKFEIHLPGRHNVLNALAAVATASTFSPAEAAMALGEFRPAKMRGERLSWRGAVLINDCYNSNPRAAQSMLEWLGRAPAAGRRIAVLGEMLELGTEGPVYHRKIGACAVQAADYLVAVRGHGSEIAAGALDAGMPADRCRFAETPEEAAGIVAGWVRPGDVVLFKASRGVRLERAIEALMSPGSAGVSPAPKAES